MRKEPGPQKTCSSGVSQDIPLYDDSQRKETYSSDRLHAQHKGVLGQVARVAQGVLLPQLAEQVVGAAHATEVVGKVALEERVDAAAQDEPHDGREVTGAGIGAQPLDHGIRRAEDGDQTRREDGEQLDGAPFVGQVADNLDLEGVVGVLARGQVGEVCSSHCGCVLGEGELKPGLKRMHEGAATATTVQVSIGEWRVS